MNALLQVKSKRDDWFFGHVPSTWKVLPLKFVCLKSSVYGANVSADNYVSEGVRFLRTTDILEDGSLSDDNTVFIEFDTVKEYLLDDGNLLLSRSGTLGRSYIHKEKNGPCAYAGYLVKFVFDSSINPDFIFYLTKTTGFIDWLSYSTIESTIGNINGEKFSNFIIPVPQLNIQNQIVRKLNQALDEILKLIGTKEKQLNILSEKREALITHAVTKGLAPKAKLKKSGSEWMGDIPEHWKLKKLKYVVEKIDQYVTESAFVIAVENIESNTGKIIPTEKTQFYEGSLNAFKTNDVIFNKLRPYLAKVYLAESEGACVGELLILRSKGEVSPEFLFYRFLSQEFITNVDSSTQGAKMPRASWEDYIRHLKIAFPSIKEQKAIISELESELKIIYAIKTKTTFSIDLLNEKRAALITAAVTGQI